MEVYSVRNRPAPSSLRYDIPQNVRKRILHTLPLFLVQLPSWSNSLAVLFSELRPRLLQMYGELAGRRNESQDETENAVAVHFFSCDPPQILDFLELTFRSEMYSTGNEQAGVDAINALLRECAIGYEFTPWVMHLGEKLHMGPGTSTGARAIERIEYPRALKLDHLHQHEEIIRPCLQILSDSRFKIANHEMLKAHDEYRHGRYEDAITSCGAAFESTLKTLCTLKGWAFDADRDTCSKLVGICRDNGLFPRFYAPIFEATGTIRNKLGDAHGRGPTPQYKVGQEHVQHVLQLTSAHIILLVSTASV